MRKHFARLCTPNGSFCFHFDRNFWARQGITSAVKMQLSLSTASECGSKCRPFSGGGPSNTPTTEKGRHFRSEEHTSELQSRFDLVCRLLLEKKKKKQI